MKCPHCHHLYFRVVPHKDYDGNPEFKQYGVCSAQNCEYYGPIQEFIEGREAV